MVILGLEHGVTWAASDDDAFTLNSAIAGATKNAEVRGNPKVLRSSLGYAAASRSLGSAEAFMDASKYLVANMMKSISKKLEIEILYGQMGYGTVGVNAVGTLVTISTAEYAAGIWAGAEGMPVEIRDSTGVTIRGTFTIVSVDMDARTLTLSASAQTAGVVATDIIWHTGAYGKEFAGIHKILTQSTGTLFNIPVTYNLFRGNSYAAGSAALSFTKVNQAAARAVEKGLDSKMTAMVNPKTWANLNNDQAALRQFDSSYKPSVAQRGNETLEFFSQNGVIAIEASIYVKEGYAYLLALDTFMRIGSTEVTFKTPGQGDNFFRQLDNQAGYELRLYTDQALFCSAPGHSVVITGIVNAA